MMKILQGIFHHSSRPNLLSPKEKLGNKNSIQSNYMNTISNNAQISFQYNRQDKMGVKTTYNMDWPHNCYQLQYCYTTVQLLTSKGVVTSKASQQLTTSNPKCIGPTKSIFSVSQTGSTNMGCCRNGNS